MNVTQTVTPSAAPTTASPAPTKTVTASPPQVLINNNNPVPAPTQTVYVPPVNESDPWSTEVAYISDVNNGDASDAWNMFGPSVRAGWNNNYNTFAAWVDQTEIMRSVSLVTL